MDILAARKKAAERARAKKAEPAGQSAGQPAPAEEATQPVAADTSAPPAVASAGNAMEPPQVPETPPVESTDIAEVPDIQELELLSFQLGGEAYAIAVDDVREVLKVRELTVVPNAPEHILGVLSLRGAMLPVVDLVRRLGLSPGVRDDKSRIIVAGVEEDAVGLMVDRVTGVVRVREDAIKPAPENIERGAEYLSGIVRKDDRLFILLDLVKALGV